MLGRRPDGFHEVETVLLALAWGDDVEVVVSEEEGEGIDLEVETSDTDVPRGEENLAWRAAAAYRDAARRVGKAIEGRVGIRLVKRIPPGAGLGGGSSDAAAVLSCLEEETGALGEEALCGLAATLGSDVPFFLLGSGAAVGRGRGERLAALERPPPRDVVLILPGTRHDTAYVYAHVPERGSAKAGAHGAHGGLDAAVSALVRGEAGSLRAAYRNALLPATLDAYPGFGPWAEKVASRLGRPPALSGTGSTLYDLPAPGEVDEVLRRLADLPGRVLHVSS